MILFRKIQTIKNNNEIIKKIHTIKNINEIIQKKQ